MVSGIPWWFAFFPHYLLVFFLPPSYPLNYLGGAPVIDHPAFWGKMLVTFPASLVYAAALVATGTALLQLCRRLTRRFNE